MADGCVCTVQRAWPQRPQIPRSAKPLRILPEVRHPGALASAGLLDRLYIESVSSHSPPIPHPVLDENAQTLFLTEMVRGMSLALRMFFEPKYTVQTHTSHAVEHIPAMRGWACILRHQLFFRGSLKRAALWSTWAAPNWRAARQDHAL